MGLGETGGHGAFDDLCGVSGHPDDPIDFSGLCGEPSGFPVQLRRTGSEYRWRYQFSNPLLQPFVLMKGISSGRVTEEQLNILEDFGDEYPLFRAVGH